MHRLWRTLLMAALHKLCAFVTFESKYSLNSSWLVLLFIRSYLVRKARLIYVMTNVAINILFSTDLSHFQETKKFVTGSSWKPVLKAADNYATSSWLRIPFVKIFGEVSSCSTFIGMLLCNKTPKSTWKYFLFLFQNQIKRSRVGKKVCQQFKGKKYKTIVGKMEQKRLDDLIAFLLAGALLPFVLFALSVAWPFS